MVRLETTGSASRMALVLAAESAPLVLVGLPSARVARSRCRASPNGVRVPPVAALTAARVPPAVRAATLTLVSALVLGAGFVALLAAGPALALAGTSGLWAAIAATQTAAAALFAQSTVRTSLPRT